jgi:fatty acid desaturase
VSEGVNRPARADKRSLAAHAPNRHAGPMSAPIPLHPPATPPVEWPTIALIAFAHLGWGGAGLWLWPLSPVLALAVMAVFAALHSSLTHECLHGHPTRNRLVNEALCALPLTIIYPYRRYKATHLAHHADERLTDPFEDPESYYKARWKLAAMPRWFRSVLTINNTMIGRVILGPVLGAGGFLMQEWAHLRRGTRGVRRAWALHLPGLVVVLAAVWAMGIPFWLYGVAVAWPALSLIAIRTYAEHRWHESPDGRTIIVERSPLGWLYLHNNLHIVHHQFPMVPWYLLPRFYGAHRAHFRALNHGYWYPNYLALFRAHALRPKEPVAHPALHCTPKVERVA